MKFPKIVALLGLLVIGWLGSATAQVTRFVVTQANSDTIPVGNNGATPITAGTPFNVKVRAVDATGATVTSYAGPVTLTLPDLLQANGAWAFLDVTLAAGVLDNVAITPTHAGTGDRRIAVTDGNISTYDAGLLAGQTDGLFTIRPNRFLVTHAGSPRALDDITYVNGNTLPVRVFALNSDDSYAQTYVGIVTLSSALTSTVAVEITSGGFEDSEVVLTSDGVGSISATDGLVTTTLASAPFTVLPTLEDAAAATYDAAHSQTFGTLTIGRTYKIRKFIAGDNFTNVNADDALNPTANFVAIATTPLNFANGSTVVDRTDYVATSTNHERVGISAVSAVSRALSFGGTAVSVSFTATNPKSGAAAVPGTPPIPAVPPIDVEGPIDYTIELLNDKNDVVASRVLRSDVGIAGNVTADTTQTLTANVTVPDTVPAGTFRVRVTAVQSASGTFQLTGLPNLRINRFDYAPGQYRGGEALRFDMAWGNVGEAIWPTLNGANNYRVEIHLSSNNVFGDDDDILVWEGTYLHALVSDQSVSESDAILLPKNIPGSYYLLAKVNSAGGRVSTTDINQNFASGLVEKFGPANGFNVLDGSESAKITLLPEQSAETTRVSLFDGRTEADTSPQSNGLSDQPAISQDGQFTVFQSRGVLSSGTVKANTYNIYKRDKMLNTTTLLTAGVGESAANGDSLYPHVDSAGRYVVFQSASSNLTYADSNAFTDTFIKDTLTGNTIKIAPTASTQMNQGTTLPDISGDGRFVVFESTATNIPTINAAGAEPVTVTTYGARQIYMYDRDLDGNGAFDEVGTGKTGFFLLSKNTTTGLAGFSSSSSPRISRDGRHVVFSTKASNLLGANVSFSQVLRWSRAALTANIVVPSSTTLLTVSTPVGAGARADGDTGFPVVSESGEYVVYSSKAKNLTADINALGIPHLFRTRITAGAVAEVSRINAYSGAAATASLNGAGQIEQVTVTQAGSGYTAAPAVSISDGVTTDTGTATIDVFTGQVLSITVTNPTRVYASTPIVTIGAIGLTEPNNPDYGFVSMPDLGSFEPAISDDGMLISYVSESNNLLPPIPVHHIDGTTYQSESVKNYQDRTMASDVYVTNFVNPVAPLTKRASVSSMGYEATPMTVDGFVTAQIVSSRAPAVSGDGRFVAFASDAKGHNGLIFGSTNFDYLATNTVKDIYLYDNKSGLFAGLTTFPTVLLEAATATVKQGVALTLNATATTTRTNGTISHVSFREYFTTISGTPTKTVDDYIPSGTNVPKDKYEYVFAQAKTGTYFVVADAYDDQGNVTASFPYQITVTQTASPTVEFKKPTNESEVLVAQKTSLNIGVTFTEPGASVSNVEFYANGEFLGFGIPEGETGTFAFDWIPIATGAYSLRAEVTDSLGNRGEATLTRVTVKNKTGAIPSVVITQPQQPSANSPYETTVNSQLNLISNASDSDGTIKSVEFFLTKGRKAKATGTITFPFVLVNGQLLQRTVGFFGSFNITDGGEGYLFAPTVTILGDGTGATAVAELTNGVVTGLLITNPGNGYTNMRIAFTGGGLVENASLGTATQVNPGVGTAWKLTKSNLFSIYGAGFYTISAQAKDNDDNIQTSAVVSVNVSPSPVGVTNTFGNAANDAYNLLLGRDASSADLLELLSLLGPDGKADEVAAVLVSSDKFTDSAWVLNGYLAANGIYPTQDQFQTGLDRLAVLKASNSSTYVAAYLTELFNGVYGSGYNYLGNARTVALRAYRNVLGVAASTKKNTAKASLTLASLKLNLTQIMASRAAATSASEADLVEQVFKNGLSSGQSIGLVVNNYITTLLNTVDKAGAADALKVLKRAQVAGLALAFTDPDQRPSFAEVNVMRSFSLPAVAELYGTGDTSDAIPPVIRTQPNASTLQAVLIAKSSSALTPTYKVGKVTLRDPNQLQQVRHISRRAEVTITPRDLPTAGASATLTVINSQKKKVTSTTLKVTNPALAIANPLPDTQTLPINVAMTPHDLGNGVTYVYTLVSGTLPTGLSLAATGEITGTPTVAGTSTFTYKATKGSAVSATLTATIIVE